MWLILYNNYSVINMARNVTWPFILDFDTYMCFNGFFCNKFLLDLNNCLWFLACWSYSSSRSTGVYAELSCAVYVFVHRLVFLVWMLSTYYVFLQFYIFCNLFAFVIILLEVFGAWQFAGLDWSSKFLITTCHLAGSRVYCRPQGLRSAQGCMFN